MILLKTLQLNNFISHESTTIYFKDNEKILLDGKSGSGKSSITESIIFALYGRGRSENRSLIRRGAKMASVSLTVSEGHTIYIITRSVSSNGKNALAITFNNSESEGKNFLPIEKTGLKDHQEWLEKTLLKASYELFTNSICYPQENENSFVKANAARRKDLLLEIVQAENFDDLYVKARNAITVNELDSAANTANLATTEEVIKESKVFIDDIEKHQKAFNGAKFMMDSFNLAEKELEKQLNDISQVSRQLSDKKQLFKMTENALSLLEIRIKDSLKEIDKHHEIDIENAKDDLKILEILKKEVEGLERDLNDSAINQQQINAHLANKPTVFDYTREIEEMNKRLIPLVGETGKCPAGDKCPFVKPIQGQIDFLSDQITIKTNKMKEGEGLLKTWEQQLMSSPPAKDVTDLYQKLKDIKEEMTRLAKANDVIEEYNTFELNLTELNVQIVHWSDEMEAKQREMDKINKEIFELEKILSNFDSNKINQKISETRLNKVDVQKTLDTATYGIKMGESATIRLKEATGVINRLKSTLHKAVEDKEALELLKEALSPRGVKAVIIDYLVPQLEDRINGVLAQMSEFRIRLDTQKATADEEGVKEGLFITVINDRMEELPFAAYSGGEKVKITVAISEALASLMNQIGFRIMDENIVSLDRESTEGFVDVLAKLQIKFPQLIVVSHLQEVKDLFEKQVMIIKANGVSKIYE